MGSLPTNKGKGCYPHKTELSAAILDLNDKFNMGIPLPSGVAEMRDYLCLTEVDESMFKGNNYSDSLTLNTIKTLGRIMPIPRSWDDHIMSFLFRPVKYYYLEYLWKPCFLYKGKPVKLNILGDRLREGNSSWQYNKAMFGRDFSIYMLVGEGFSYNGVVNRIKELTRRGVVRVKRKEGYIRLKIHDKHIDNLRRSKKLFREYGYKFHG